jgi:plastocyanin
MRSTCNRSWAAEMRRSTLLLLGVMALPAAAWCETHVVTIEGMKFVPAVVTVKRGDTVTWQNKDLVPHTATATGGKPFDSGEIVSDKRWSWTARDAGRVSYDCTYHPGMKGVVVVQ